jgi:nicotinamidase/pyrazinamidase
MPYYLLICKTISCQEVPWVCPRATRLFLSPNRVQEYFDLVIATADWHPPGHGSFASAHPGREAGDVIELSGLPQVLWPDHCVQHSEGAAFPPVLDTQR